MTWKWLMSCSDEGSFGCFKAGCGTPCPLPARSTSTPPFYTFSGSASPCHGARSSRLPTLHVEVTEPLLHARGTRRSPCPRDSLSRLSRTQTGRVGPFPLHAAVSERARGPRNLRPTRRLSVPGQLCTTDVLPFRLAHWTAAPNRS